MLSHALIFNSRAHEVSLYAPAAFSRRHSPQLVMGPVWAGTLGSLAAGLLTGAGALLVLFRWNPSDRANDTLLGFAAGVMLAASFFSLIIPALEHAGERYRGNLLPAAIVVAGTWLGSLVVALMNRFIPHEHFMQGRDGLEARAVRQVWLFVFAIAIHNLPEGMAVGVGFASGEMKEGLSLAIGIGLQNMPEGLAVAVALTARGYSRRNALLIATATGLVEPIGGLTGAAVLSLSEALLPWGMVFAAGAMLFVISHEIIPETHSGKYHREATFGLMTGMGCMMFLDISLG